MVVLGITHFYSEMKVRLTHLNNSIFILIALIIFMIFIKKAILVVFFSFFLVMLLVVWYRILGEELVVSLLKENSGELEKKEVINNFNKKAMSLMRRLERKKIILTKDDKVYLIDKNYITAFERQGGKRCFSHEKE